MKNFGMLLVLAVFAIVAVPVIAHHPAANIVDEEIYEMIDLLVADTPHGTMDLTSMGADITGGVRDFEMMVEGGLLSLVSGLDGEVTMTLEFDSYQSVDVTIIQDGIPVDSTKAAPDSENTSLGDLKASFR